MKLLVKAGVTSGLIHVVADILAQAVETRGQSLTNPAEAHNAERTKRFAFVGLTLHGPYFQRGFALVDQRFGTPTSMRVVMKKTLAVQAFVNPPYMLLLFSYLGLLEGRRGDEVLQNTKDKFMPAFWAGNVFWPIANFLNFKYLGPQYRVAYVASCGAVWNTFISMLNQRYSQQQHKGTTNIDEVTRGHASER